MTASPDQSADTVRQFGHWNYRVLKRTYDGEDSFEMIECYYDQYERITAWSNASPGGSTLKELEDCLQRMVIAAGLSALVSGKRMCLTLADLPGTDALIDGSGEA